MKLEVFGKGLLAGCLMAGVAGAQQGSTVTTDQQFVDLAAQSDMTEAHLGEAAAERSSSPDVKAYAQALVADHTKSYSQLSMVASKANLSVPKGLDPMQEKMMAPLMKLKGPAFDKKFVQMMVSGHETATSAFDKESRDGQNPELKAYAKSALPILEKHKNDAEALMKTKGKPKS